jgi:hypothetical protein
VLPISASKVAPRLAGARAVSMSISATRVRV